MKIKSPYAWASRFVLVCCLLLVSCSSNGSFPGNIFASGPTATPTLTPTPTTPPPTPTPTATPTPIPTPTPVPAKRVESGDHALFNGDWETAAKEYQQSLDGSQDPDIQAAALLGMGRAYFYQSDYPRALESLRKLIDSYPNSSHRADGYFFLGEVYNALDRYREAAEAYLGYLQLRPGLIDSYVLELRGDALWAANDYGDALTEYQAASNSPHIDGNFTLQTKLAHAYAITGDYATALVAYQDIYNRSTIDFTKAYMDLLLGEAYTAIGQTENANNAYLDAVENYPVTNEAYQSLVALLDAGFPVDELDRGLVDYFAGQYQVAINAFDRYLGSNSEEAATARYYRGLAQVAQGDILGAIYQWDLVIQDYQGASVWDNAWEQKAYYQWYKLEDYSGAIETLTGFVKADPAQPRAAEFLYDAGRVAERIGELNQAASLWERAANEYPSSDYAYRSAFQAGISYYRLGDYPTAQATFQRLADLTTDPVQKSGANFWVGKAENAQGDVPTARTTWEKTANLDPTGYYSERARDLLQGKAPFTPPQSFDFGSDQAAEKAQAESWLRANFNLPPEVDLGPGPLLADPRAIRGTELWRLGLYSQAQAEFDSLQASLDNDAAGLYRLANYLVTLGDYRPTILAARRILDLTGMTDATTLYAPVYFNRLRFGTYYSDLVIPQAQAYGVSPFLIFSVIRQESFFESVANSSAGARGLMQFIPATGKDRANRLNWPPNYTDADLDRPVVSITFGASYLHELLSYLDQDLYAALAAYNGGPGNAKDWQDLSNGDPDLFLEVVRFSETHTYIVQIYEMFNIYSRLYNRTP